MCGWALQVMGGSSGEMDDLLTYQHCQQEVSSCTSLQFYQAGLTSTIPTTIGLLTALTNLVLQFNFLKVRLCSFACLRPESSARIALSRDPSLEAAPQQRQDSSLSRGIRTFHFLSNESQT